MSSPLWQAQLRRRFSRRSLLVDRDHERGVGAVARQLGRLEGLDDVAEGACRSGPRRGPASDSSPWRRRLWRWSRRGSEIASRFASSMSAVRFGIVPENRRCPSDPFRMTQASRCRKRAAPARRDALRDPVGVDGVDVVDQALGADPDLPQCEGLGLLDQVGLRRRHGCGVCGCPGDLGHGGRDCRGPVAAVPRLLPTPGASAPWPASSRSPGRRPGRRRAAAAPAWRPRRGSMAPSRSPVPECSASAC